MIQEFVDTFMANQDKLRERFAAAHPDGYLDIVKAVIEIISDGEDWDAPDPDRIHRIDDGDYQGTLVFVIASKGYQPHDYWYVKVFYGSCSGCDTYERIRGWDWDAEPTKGQVDDYMTLALHIVQRLGAMQ